MKLLKSFLHTLVDWAFSSDVSFRHPPRVLHLGEQEGRYCCKVRTVSVSDEAIKIRVYGWHADGVPREGDRLYVDADDNLCEGSVAGIFEFVDVEEIPDGQSETPTRQYRGVVKQRVAQVAK